MDKFNKPRLAWIVTISGLFLFVLAVYFSYMSRGVVLPDDQGLVYGIVITTFPLFGVQFLGLFIILRTPAKRYGWVWLLAGFSFGVVLPLGQSYATYAIAALHNTLPFAKVATQVADYGWGIGISMVPFILLYFPTGTAPTRRWQFLGRLVTLALIVVILTGWAISGEGIQSANGAGFPGAEVLSIITAAGNIAVFFIFLAIPLASISLINRYLLADRVVRQQLKWFAFGAMIFSVLLASDFFYTAPGLWEPIKEALIFSILPLVVGIAILRHRLWDIDVIIRKTLVYSALTSMLVLLYSGTVVLLQSVLEAITDARSPIVIVVSTLFIATLFNPLRHRIQTVIDRRFYRRKYDAVQMLARFAETARDEVDLERLTLELLVIVEQALQPENSFLWLNSPPMPGKTAGVNK